MARLGSSLRLERMPSEQAVAKDMGKRGDSVAPTMAASQRPERTCAYPRKHVEASGAAAGNGDGGALEAEVNGDVDGGRMPRKGKSRCEFVHLFVTAGFKGFDLSLVGLVGTADADSMETATRSGAYPEDFKSASSTASRDDATA